MHRSLYLSFFPVGLVVACADPSSPSQIMPDAHVNFAQVVADPSATVKLPINDAALSLRSDGKFSDGTYASYADGVCGVNGRIFTGGSGDAVIDAGNPRYADRKCSSYPRKMAVLYPDGSAETIAGVLVSVQELQNSAFVIPVGSAALRHFHVRTATSRCDGVHWGGAVGGDSVLVTRAAANTWHVTTQAYPNDQAACKNANGNYVLGHMPVDLWIVSSRNLQ